MEMFRAENFIITTEILARELSSLSRFNWLNQQLTVALHLDREMGGRLHASIAESSGAGIT